MLSRRGFLVTPLALLATSPFELLGEDPERTSQELPETPSAESQTQSRRRRRLLYFASPACELCREFERTELDALRVAGWTVGTTPDKHIQILDITSRPALARRYGIASVPALLCVQIASESAELRRWDGRYMFDRWTVNHVYCGDYEFPEYPLREHWWTLNGTTDHPVDVMIAHMDSGFHAEKFDRRWLESRTLEELHSLHSDDHELKVEWSSAVRLKPHLLIPDDETDTDEADTEAGESPEASETTYAVPGTEAGDVRNARQEPDASRDGIRNRATTRPTPAPVPATDSSLTP